MKFTLNCDEKLSLCASRLAKKTDVVIGEGGIVLNAVACEKPTLRVTCDGRQITVYYKEICQFNRGFGLAVEHLGKGENVFDISEKPQFETNGVMFDMCHGYGAFKTDCLKDIIDRLALMGLNTLMLYLEENYEVEGQPYMGYMRPSYSKKMLREVDDYAWEMGIEMIPCIQTLAHLKAALRWDVYGDYQDYDDCLLVGDERTYKFVDDVIRANSEAFRSRRIHIGMDEAWELGSGRYLRRFGYEKQVDIMQKHLARVIEICEKYGMKPMMWDDMFFHAMDESHMERTPENIRKMCPEAVQPVFWHYGCPADRVFADHVLLSPETIFAGGCWAWFGFACAYDWTFKSTLHCLQRCKRAGVREVFMTTWGDHGSEAPQPVNLVGAQMYAEIGYADDWDEEKFRERFAFCTGGQAEDFRQLQYFDVTPVTDMNTDMPEVNASKMFLWQDILTGLFDRNIGTHDLRAHYHALSKTLEGADRRNGMFNSMFTLFRKAAAVMELKADMGCRLTRAYRAGDRNALEELSSDLGRLLERTEDMTEYYRSYWNEIYMPLGWGKFDLRFGGLLARIKTAKRTVDAYLNGETDSVPELEAERLPFTSANLLPKWCNEFWKIIAPEMD